MRSLFADDDRLSFLRQPIGASDFVAGDSLHLRRPAGRAGPTTAMRRFSIAHDRAEILPLLRQALALNPQLKVIGSPWSPPAWMKTNQSLIGGRLIDEPRIYAAYARYLVKFVQAYERAGVPIYAVTVQNEPQNRNPSGYPGMDMPVAQEAKLIEALGPALRRGRAATRRSSATTTTGPSTPNDIASTPPGEDPETEYPTQLLESARRRAGSPAPRSTATAATRAARPSCTHAFPDKGVWFTECSGSHGATDPPAQVFSDTLKWHARNLVLGVTRNWGKTVVNWNLALDPAGGPHNGGCDTCTGVVTVGPGQTVTRNAEYYTLGHLARFVRPGAVRIASTSFGTTGWNGQIMDVAFRNRDGSTALVVHNENDDPRSFAVAQGGSIVRVHAARRRARDVHVAGLARRSTTAARCSARAAATAATPPTATPSTTTPRRAGRTGAAQAAGPVAAGRPRPRAARAPRRARHRRRHGRLPARLRAAHQRRRRALERGGRAAPATAS